MAIVGACPDGAQSSVDAWLDAALPRVDEPPERVHAAMRHGALGGGKRLRPLLALATGDALGVDRGPLLQVAGALELLHASSLIHDDLPSMDDDDMRRGRPSCHKAFGEAAAILAGDALIVLAFEHVASIPAPAAHAVAITRELARAVGSRRGLVAGQGADLWPAASPGVDDLERTHAAKTGALFGVALVAPAILAGRAPAEVERLRGVGTDVGTAFQIADDLADDRPRGRAPGSDRRRGRKTFATVAGRDVAERRARSLLDRSVGALRELIGTSAPLDALIAAVGAS